MGSVGVRYKCRCMDEEVELLVPERKPAMDVVMWMEDVVTPRVTGDHISRSPRCQATKLEYLKLPAPPDGAVGSNG